MTENEGGAATEVTEEAATAVTAASTTLEEAMTKLKAWASSAWGEIETSAEALEAKLIPVVESDVVTAIETYGEDLVDDAIELLEAGIAAPAAISGLASNLIGKATEQGKTIAASTAATVAGQVLTAAQLQAAALKVA